MLLNEFLKEHKKVEEQNRKLEESGCQDRTAGNHDRAVEGKCGLLVARVAEQNSKIQRVSEKVELNKAASQLAAMDE